MGCGTVCAMVSDCPPAGLLRSAVCDHIIRLFFLPPSWPILYLAITTLTHSSAIFPTVTIHPASAIIHNVPSPSCPYHVASPLHLPVLYLHPALPDRILPPVKTRLAILELDSVAMRQVLPQVLKKLQILLKIGTSKSVRELTR